MNFVLICLHWAGVAKHVDLACRKYGVCDQKERCTLRGRTVEERNRHQKPFPWREIAPRLENNHASRDHEALEPLTPLEHYQVVAYIRIEGEDRRNSSTDARLWGSPSTTASGAGMKRERAA